MRTLILMAGILVGGSFAQAGNGWGDAWGNRPSQFEQDQQEIVRLERQQVELQKQMLEQQREFQRDQQNQEFLRSEDPTTRAFGIGNAYFNSINHR